MTALHDGSTDSVTGAVEPPQAVDEPGQKTGATGDSSLRRNIGRVAAASAVALAVGELITIVQTVALARLLTPAEVGVFVAGTVLATFLGNFVEGGLRSGLVHREDRLDDAAETVFYATILGGVVMALAALAISPVIAHIFHSGQVGLVAAVSAGVLLLQSFTHVPEALLQRNFSVRRRLIVGPAIAIAYAATAVSLAAAGCGVWSMVAGLYASSLAWVLTLWLITTWRPGRGRATLKMWRELARYGRPLVIGNIGARVQSVAEAVVVGRVLSSAALGRFRYGQRIALMPGRAIIEIGGIALFPAFSRIGTDTERMRPAYLRALRWAVVGAAMVSGLMIALGVPAVVVVLGQQWRQAGVVVVALAGLGLGKALISVSEEAIKGHGRTGLLNWYTATEVVLGIGLLLLLVRPFGLVGAALSISINALVVGITCVCLARAVVHYTVRGVLGAIVPPLPCAAVATAVTGALEHLVLRSDSRSLPTALAFLTLGSLVFVAVYLIAYALVSPSTVSTLWCACRRWVSRVKWNVRRPTPATGS